MIRNEKTVDPADPSSPRVHPARDGDGRGDLDLPRRARAARRRRPLRAREDDGDLLAVCSDAYELTADWRVVPRPHRAGDLVVDLDPAYFASVDQLDAHFPAGAPSLAACRRLSVRGDVRFGAGVACRGEVAVRAATAAPCAVPAGTRLEGGFEAPPL